MRCLLVRTVCAAFMSAQGEMWQHEPYHERSGDSLRPSWLVAVFSAPALSDRPSSLMRLARCVLLGHWTRWRRIFASSYVWSSCSWRRGRLILAEHVLELSDCAANLRAQFRQPLWAEDQ